MTLRRFRQLAAPPDHGPVVANGASVVPETLVGGSPGELHYVAVSVPVLALVVIQAQQGGLQDIGAGDVLGDGEPVDILPREPLELVDDLEQVRRLHIPWIRRLGARAPGSAKQHQGA